MASNSGVNPPVLPDPPAVYSQQYMDTLVKSLKWALAQIRNPGPVRGTTIVLTDLPTSAAGLEPGSLWNDGGTVKIV